MPDSAGILVGGKCVPRAGRIAGGEGARGGQRDRSAGRDRLRPQRGRQIVVRASRVGAAGRPAADGDAQDGNRR